MDGDGLPSLRAENRSRQKAGSVPFVSLIAFAFRVPRLRCLAALRIAVSAATLAIHNIATLVRSR